MTSSTRRAFLSVLGGLTVSTAGCISNNSDSERTNPTQFSPGEISTIIDASVPDITRPIPIEPADQTITARTATVSSIISQIPDVITEADIPNGVIRREISHRKSAAVSKIDAAVNEPSNFRSLRQLADAQGLAREAKAIYTSGRGNVSPSEIEEDQAAVKRKINQRLPALAYVGDSMDQTILLYYWLETDLLSARNKLHLNHRKRRTNPIRIGELAQGIGNARGTIEATDQLESRQRQESDGTETKFSELYRACSNAEESLREFDQLRTGAPEELVTVEIADTPAERILWTAQGGYRNVLEGLNNNITEGTVAEGIHRGITGLTRFEAYTSIIEQVNNGKYQELASIDQISETRETIQRYLENPPITTGSVSIIADHFAELATWIASVDDSIRQYANTDDPNRIEREYAEYVHLSHRLQALQNAEQAYNSWLANP